MFTREEIGTYLDKIATRFEDHAQNYEEPPNGIGWGQFLDAPKRHMQVGLYGTAAGVISLAIAGREGGRLEKARSVLCEMWKSRDRDDRARQRLVQLPRLSFLYLALRLSKSPVENEVLSELEQELIGRLLPNHMWGNFWIADALRDDSPRVFPSALAVLSLVLFREDRDAVGQQVARVLGELEPRIYADRYLPPLDRIAAIAALLAGMRGNSTGKCHSAMKELARKSYISLNDRGVYFFDYDYMPINSEDIKFKRDYFIIPTDILLGIAGYQDGAPGALRMAAIESVNVLIENLRLNGGLYKPGEGGRFSSVDQAWVSLLLKLAQEQSQKPKASVVVLHALTRERKGNWITNRLAPPVLFLLTLGLSIMASEYGMFEKVWAAISMAIVGSIYGAPVITRLFPGRQ